MEIIVRAVGNKQHHDFLEKKVKPKLYFVLRCLSRAYHFTLPPELYLIPKRQKHATKCKDCETVCRVRKTLCAYGRAGIGERYPLYISINIQACRRDKYLLETLGHEAAHIAEYCIKGVLSHSPFMYKLDQAAQVLTKRKECD